MDQTGFIPYDLLNQKIFTIKMAVQISKKRNFVADGIFKAELNEFLTQERAEDDYPGVESELRQPGQKFLFWPPGRRMFLVRRANGDGN